MVHEPWLVVTFAGLAMISLLAPLVFAFAVR